MTSLFRLLSALVLAIGLALPGIDAYGGENGGGTGVWVLPRATFLTAAIGPVRSTVTAVPTQDLILQMSPEIGAATAVFIDDLSQVPVSLPVTGLQARLPASVMQAFVASSVPTATIMIVDAAQVGYLIQVVVQTNGTLLLKSQ